MAEVLKTPDPRAAMLYRFSCKLNGHTVNEVDVIADAADQFGLRFDDSDVLKIAVEAYLDLAGVLACLGGISENHFATMAVTSMRLGRTMGDA